LAGSHCWWLCPFVPFCALSASWLIYRVMMKAQKSRALTRIQEAWMAAEFLALGCTEATSGVSLLRLLPINYVADVALAETACSLATIVAARGLIGALIPGIWWLLLPWWAPVWLRPRSRRDATPRQ